MHKIRHFAFTLVELLVVIAILAILATVSVVGYLGFTERAHISNDTTLAAQLDTLVKAEDVNNPITSEDDLLNLYYKTFGEPMSTLEPESAKYGYHFWYNINEKSVILSKSKDLSNNQSLVTTLANNENQFSDSLREELVDGYYLMDGKGSALADALTLSDTIDSKEKYVSLLNNIQKVEKDEPKEIYDTLNEVNSKTAYITNVGTFRKSANVDKVNRVKVSKGLTKTVAAMYTYKEETTTTFSSLFKAKELTVDNLEESFISEENPIATLSNNEVIKLPSSIESIGTNSMFFNVEGHAHLLLDGKTEEKIKDAIRVHSTNLVYIVNNRQYKFINETTLKEVDEETLEPIGPDIVVNNSDIKVNNFELYFKYNDKEEQIANYNSSHKETQLPLDVRTVEIVIKNFSFTFGDDEDIHVVKNPSMNLFEFTSDNDSAIKVINNNTLSLVDGNTSANITTNVKNSISSALEFEVFVTKIDSVQIQLEGQSESDNYEVEYKKDLEVVLDIFVEEIPNYNIANKDYSISIVEGENIASLSKNKDGKDILKISDMGVVKLNVKMVHYDVSDDITINVTDPISRVFDYKFINKNKYLYRIGNKNNFNLYDILLKNYTYIDEETGKPMTPVDLSSLDIKFNFYMADDWHSKDFPNLKAGEIGTNEQYDALDNARKAYLIPETIQPGNSVGVKLENNICKFEGTGVIIIETVAVIKDSPNKQYRDFVAIEVVDAYNVDNFNEPSSITSLKANENRSVVLLNNIKWSKKDINDEKSKADTLSFTDDNIYGNGFIIDASVSGRITTFKGLISITNSNIDNLVLIGTIYDKVEITKDNTGRIGYGIETLGDSCTITNTFVS